MQDLKPGQNHPVAHGRVTIGVIGEPCQELATKTQTATILLDTDGKARQAADLINAQQPSSRDGAVVFAGYPPAFTIELGAMPAEVERVALIMAIEPGQRAGITFSIFGELQVWLTDAADKPLLRFLVPPALRGETALILAELYRYRGQWKFRAIGQGFAAGWPALVAHFGLPPTALPPAVLEPPLAAQDFRPTNLVAANGSGLCVHSDGYVLTNYHVVENVKRLSGTMLHQHYRLETVFTDPSNDLALLRADAPFSSVATFRADHPIQLGESVVVVGYPLAGLLGSDVQVTTGNVSALVGVGDDTRWLQFTAPTQRGNSGSPLLDQHGAVLGMVSAKLNAGLIQAVTGDIPQNVNFAIKVALLRGFLEAAGIVYQSCAAASSRSTADIATAARDFVVRIDCEG